jgi:hypothetical protein
MQQRVVVWGKPILIDVQQRSKRVWVASGEYMGETVQTTDRTAGAAAKRWQEAARSRGG